MQSPKQSFIESCVDIGIGFVIALAATFVINKLHQIDIPVWKNLTMTLCFTVVSLIRRYLVRRWFNKKEK